MRGSRLIGAVAIVFLWGVFSSCGKSRAEWQGRIEESEGITVVINPAEPIFEPDVFQLEDELNVGIVENSAETIFSEVSGVAVCEDGRIFVLDAKECRVLVFDTRGDPLNSIGRRGQGPGEMQNPQAIQVTPQREILVHDLQADRILFFSLSGEFLRYVSTAAWPNLSKPLVDSRGGVVADYSIPGPIFRRELSKFDARFESDYTIHTLELFEMPVMQAMFPEFFWQITEDDRIIWGYSTRYELQILDSRGRLVRRITKVYDPVRLTEKDKEERLNFLFGGVTIPGGLTLEWPEHNWAFGDLSRDEEGRLFLQTFERTPDGKSHLFDVFDREGKYVAKIPLPSKPQAWKNGKLYLIEENDDGYHYVKRYGVSWALN